MSKLEKLENLSKKIEEGLDYEGLIQLRKQVYNVKVEIFSDEWYQKRQLLTCIKEFLDESTPTKAQQEQAILKEYQYDWAIIENNEYYLELVNDCFDYLKFDKREKRYECYYCRQFTADENKYSALIDYKTHNLIHKLATLWGWLE